jgi:fatty acid desaturase
MRRFEPCRDKLAAGERGKAPGMTETMKRGEEFRESERRGSPLSAERVRALSAIDPLKATLALGQTVGVLAAAIAAAILWWSPPVVLGSIIVIAARQQACFVLAHDAAHYRLYETRWLNDAVGRLFGAVVGVSMCTYRVIHRLHHNHLYEPQDPDLPLHGGYPRGRAYLLKKLLRDVLGLTAFKTYAYFFGAPAINTETGAANRPLDDTAPALRRAARRDRWMVAGFHIAAPTTAFAAGYGTEYLVLWALPLVTLLQPILRFRAICEHGAVKDLSSPLTAARTNLAPFWARWLLFPHHVNYHLEHHLYPSIPHYNLPACHRALVACGALAQAEVRSVFATARLVAADP